MDFHIGPIPDVKCYGHTTSPLVTSVGTRCEMSISTDVKCHFCSSEKGENHEEGEIEVQESKIREHNPILKN
ncbi:hypothetical protein MTR_4g016760 [Medicago truncatula]|uniref:Uncharacterized protein n=1 Tax=Medicago truncatula TaxID=3880 RepID=G7JP49_MEDTR|nr:hypothetical protein MTR_4g016760 [Medicago truncatula]